MKLTAAIRRVFAVNQRLALTPRQREVLGLLMLGMTDAEIAGALFITTKSVKTHTSAIYARLNIEGGNPRVLAAMYAVRSGLVQEGSKP